MLGGPQQQALRPPEAISAKAPQFKRRAPCDPGDPFRPVPCWEINEEQVMPGRLVGNDQPFRFPKDAHGRACHS